MQITEYKKKLGLYYKRFQTFLENRLNKDKFQKCSIRERLKLSKC